MTKKQSGKSKSNAQDQGQPKSGSSSEGGRNVMQIDNAERQRRYVEKQREKGGGLGVVFADAFLRGMRDIGYKNPAWAFAELIDNAVQAGAPAVSLRLGYFSDNTSEKKPDQIAVVDSGNGMIPEMISYAVRWGGTDREDDRTGFGRYGYGLPSSVISMAKRYTVFSKVEGNKWHAVTVDIDELTAAAGDIEATDKLLKPKPASPPQWVADAEGDNPDEIRLKELRSGTVIVLEELDRLRAMPGWITTRILKAKLMQHFGVIYRHWVPQMRIVVDGDSVEAVDPLFLMEHARHFDETEVRAVRVLTKQIQVETPLGARGAVSIRASYLPPNFGLADPGAYGTRSANNKRFEVMKEYNGLLICRENRQIDCIPPKWTSFQNNDRHVRIEINFDPTLDEFFGITTSKQQIVIDDTMWDRLRQSGNNSGGLHDLIVDIRRKFGEDGDAIKAAKEQKANQGPRPSITAMDRSAKFKGKVPEPSRGQRERAARNLEDEAKRRAGASGKPVDEERKRLVEETSKQRWRIDYQHLPESPFYRPDRFGEQKLLILNTAHPFYQKVYDRAPEVRAGLEILLFVLAEREIEANEDVERFYKAERQRWSERLRHALDELEDGGDLAKHANAVAEAVHEPEE